MPTAPASSPRSSDERTLRSAARRITERMTTINDAAAAEARALAQDAADPLRALPRRVPDSAARRRASRRTSAATRSACSRARRAQAVDDGARRLGAHSASKAISTARMPWMPYHEFVRDDLAAVVGAQPCEVVAMNSLTVNLHLMMVSFYRPTAERPAILIEKRRVSRPTATRSNRRSASTASIRRRALIEARSRRAGRHDLDAAIERALAEHGARIALVLLARRAVPHRPGVRPARRSRALAHRTGLRRRLRPRARRRQPAAAPARQRTPISRSGAATNTSTPARAPSAAASCTSAMRNAELRASPAGGATTRRRASRWARISRRRRAPTAGSCRNPPILALAPLRVSLEMFRRAGMDALRAEIAAPDRLSRIADARTHWRMCCEIVTPREPERRGAQLSLRVRAGRDRGRALFEHLDAQRHHRRLARARRDPHLRRRRCTTAACDSCASCARSKPWAGRGMAKPAV